ncbi:MAG: response regulator [bacterium]
MKKDAKILIVDDSAFMRSVLKNILTNAGYTNFEEAADGKEGLQKIESVNPELVLLDLIMPEMLGIDVIKQIKNKYKILVISAVGQEKVIEEAKSLGALGYIVKPFDNNKVVEEVAKILG